MNKFIGVSIPIALILVAAALITLLYIESTERTRLLVCMTLTIVGVLCLEILLLQA